MMNESKLGLLVIISLFFLSQAVGISSGEADAMSECDINRSDIVSVSYENQTLDMITFKNDRVKYNISSEMNSKSSVQQAEALARGFLEVCEDRFRISPDTLRLADSGEIEEGHSLTFKQYYKDSPISGSHVTVTVTNEGAIKLINANNYQPNISLKTTNPDIGEEEAIQLAREATGLSTDPEVVELEVYDGQLSWKVWLSLRNTDKRTSNIVYIDAANGNVLAERESFETGGFAPNADTGTEDSMPKGTERDTGRLYQIGVFLTGAIVVVAIILISRYS